MKQQGWPQGVSSVGNPWQALMNRLISLQLSGSVYLNNKKAGILSSGNILLTLLRTCLDKLPRNLPLALQDLAMGSYEPSPDNKNCVILNLPMSCTDWTIPFLTGVHSKHFDCVFILDQFLDFYGCGSCPNLTWTAHHSGNDHTGTSIIVNEQIEMKVGVSSMHS